MARYVDIHPDNPQPRLVTQVVEALRADQLIAYPTDSGYALGAQLGNRDGRDRILRIRQLAVKEISPAADLVIVVGSRNSSNSVRLVEVALEAGAKASYLVDDHTEIDEAWLDGVDTVSVTSGASVPEDLVEGVLAFLAERGYPDAKAVHSAEESLIFALPPELRRDLRAAQKA